MHATMPLEDMTHENYWRQLLRWLVDGVPDPVEVAHQRPIASRPAKPVTLTADVVDPTFVELNDARVVAQGQRPAGRRHRRADAVDRRAQRRSTAARSPPRATGMYAARRRGDARRQDRSAPASTHVRAAPGDAEYFDATMHAAAAAADRRRDRRPVLHAGDGRRRCRGSAVHRPRRDDGRRARPVAHADRAAAARRADVRASGAIDERWGWRDGARTRSVAGVQRCEKRRAELEEHEFVLQTCCDCSSLAAAAAGRRRRRRRRRIWRSSSGWPASRSMRELFQRWAATLVDARPARWASTPSTSSTWPRSPKPTRSASTGQVDARRRSSRRSTSWRRRGADDVVFVVLIGHGTFDGKVAKFNLPGPDMTPADFEPLLKQLTSQHVVFVNTASASGPFVEALAGAGPDDRDRDAQRRASGSRRCSAATSSTRWPATSADADKNRRISVLEAFDFAKREVATAYEREGIMLTEHPLLDDSGDKRARRRRPPTASRAGSRRCCRSARGVRRGAAGGSEAARALRRAARRSSGGSKALKLLKDSMEPATIRRRAREARDRAGAQDAADPRSGRQAAVRTAVRAGARARRCWRSSAARRAASRAAGPRTGGPQLRRRRFRATRRTTAGSCSCGCATTCGFGGGFGAARRAAVGARLSGRRRCTSRRS